MRRVFKAGDRVLIKPEVGSTVSTIIHGIGGRSERVHGVVVDPSRPRRRSVDVKTDCHGTLVVEVDKILKPCDAVLSGAPVGACSEDLVEVWHGMADPAYACGKHAMDLSDQAVFNGHRNRNAAKEVQPS